MVDAGAACPSSAWGLQHDDHPGIDDFRSFRKLTVEGLTRVSLLVGTNNAGKTSVLEAAELVPGRTSPSILERSMRSRGEVVSFRMKQASPARYIGVNHLFHGHSLEPGMSFELEAVVGDSARTFKCRIIPSVMTQMWRLVVEVARRLDIQVLATTHSLDCVRALAALYEPMRSSRPPSTRWNSGEQAPSQEPLPADGRRAG